MKKQFLSLVNRGLAHCDAMLVRKSTYLRQMAALGAALPPGVQTPPPGSKPLAAASGGPPAAAEDDSIGASPQSVAPTVYGGGIPWEVPVQLCLRDVLRAGDCALDIGANVGGLAIAMSRMVGPTGEIHAFEANPRLVERLPGEFAANQAANVRLVPRAVWSRSDETLTFHVDHSYYASGSSLLFCPASYHDEPVKTVSIDDYCRQTGCVPRAIKVDVEGAEFQVFQGAQQTLRRLKPSIVMEYGPAERIEEDAAEFLESLGYVLIDTNLYTVVNRAFYRQIPPESASLYNLLALHKESGLLPASGPPYRVQRLARLAPLLPESDYVALAAGRYVAALTFAAPLDAEVMLAVEARDGRRITYFQNAARHLKSHASSHLVFEVDEPTDVRYKADGLGRAQARLETVEINAVVACLGSHRPSRYPADNHSPAAPHAALAGSRASLRTPLA